MHRLIIYLVIIAISASCKKEDITDTKPPATKIEYTDFNNRPVKFNESLGCDLDKDGVKDIRFHTLLVGDPLLRRDYRQFYVTSSIDTYMPVDNREEVPVMAKGRTVAANAFSGYEWFNVSAILLARKVISENQPIFWEGFWKDISNKYLPIMVVKNHQQYFGWVEVSFDTGAENIIVHNAGISKEAGKEVKAGL